MMARSAKLTSISKDSILPERKSEFHFVFHNFSDDPVTLTSVAELGAQLILHCFIEKEGRTHAQENAQPFI